MANQRIILWVALGFILWLNYQAWQQDYAPNPVPTSQQPAGESSTLPAPATAADGTLENTVPQAAAPAGPANAGAPPPAQAQTTAPPAAHESGSKVRVTTDVLDVDISLKGGTLVRAELLGYPQSKGKPGLVRLFEDAPGRPIYVLQTGLTSTSSGQQPNHLAEYSAQSREFQITPGSDQVAVPLRWTSDAGVTVTKTFTFERGSYRVKVDYDVRNVGAAPYSAASYVQVVKEQPEQDRSMFDPESYAFAGPALWDGTRYSKLDIEDDEDRAYRATVTNGWLASMQHHFVAAAVPPRDSQYEYRLEVQGRRFLFGAVGPTQTVAPGGRAVLSEALFIGPKLQEQLETLHAELDRTTDYGWLYIIAQPLFIVLAWIHELVGNWGWAIVLVTVLIKLVFYPLSEASGRSMAKMRALAPRIKNIQERYKDDREQLGRSMMELYKREKINPLAGCLPILIQIPVFLAFYWVLLESVEMRQAPFMLWIDDLSSRDPFFVLPILMGAAMFGQYKLNPAPPDPIQAKVFMFMPLIMTVMFAFFPSGLVLYWLTNTVLSIAQQWRINRVVEAAQKKVKTE